MHRTELWISLAVILFVAIAWAAGVWRTDLCGQPIAESTFDPACLPPPG